MAPDDQSLLFLADLVILHVLISYIMTRSVMELILSLQMMNNHEKPWGKNWIPKSDLKMPYFQPQMTNLRVFLANMVISHVLIGFMMTRSLMELILSVQMLNNHEKPWGENWIHKPDLKNAIFLAPDNQSL